MTAAFNLHDLDIKKFAQDGAQASDQLNLADFARVCQDLPADTARPLPAVQWLAQGQWRNVLGQTVPYAQSEVMGQPWLHLSIHTEVARHCQRCLQPMVLPVAVDRDYRFVANEETASAQDEDSLEDVLVWDKHFDLHALLEDEILLDLPLIPMHEHCPGLSTQAAPQSAAPAQADSADTQQPFAGLADLLKKSAS
jgi:uncharacterized protein